MNAPAKIAEEQNKKTPLQTPLIQNIKSKKARNLIRGISDGENYIIAKNALSKIKLCSSKSDFKKSVLFIKTNPLFLGNPIGQLLNETCPKGIPDKIEFSLEEISQQINSCSNELISILEKSIELIHLLKENKLNSSLDKCFDIVECRGVSIFLIRMISFITVRYQTLELENKETLDKIESLKTKISLSNSPIIEESINQLSNLRTSHLAIHKKINEMESTHSYIEIVKSFVRPIPDNNQDFINKLNGYFSFSVLDAFLYLKTINELHLDFIENKCDTSADLNRLFDTIKNVDFIPEKMYKKINEDSGYHYLRESFLFIEQTKAFKFLAIHGHYYSDIKSKKKSSLYSKRLLNEYFKGINSLSDIRCSEMKTVALNRDVYDSTLCGMLENSNALVHIINKCEGDISGNDEVLFVKLMSYTRDIGEICEPEYLERIASSATELSLKLVIRCLISINNKKQYAEYELRNTIQECCINEFNRDLNSLFKYLFELSPAVAEHFLLICNETFLITLFHLVEKPVDALKMRADMLHWFGEATNNERYLDRAKTLRIDIQINKERDTIDDSRIYVDPFKYSQWFEDNMVSKLTMAIDNLMISNNRGLTLDWDKKNRGVGATETIIDHLLECYNEFCNNSMFGIASYLGRRIRHGTFRGTAITELSDLSKKDEYKALFDDKEFKGKFDSWLKNYEAMIGRLEKTYLQIKQRKKPYGIITTDIDSPYKKTHADQLVYDILSVYSSKIGVARLPSLIIDYCWRLVEIDLRATRKLLSEMKSIHGVFSYLPRVASDSRKRRYSKFSREINLVVSKKFTLMSSWFNKPSYASPSTDIYLLFRAVISEVKGNVSHFDPKYSIEDLSFPIVGGTYYVIYDALYVLIHNAAIHGKLDGEIIFDVRKPDERNALLITLTTELSLRETYTETKNKIEAALADQDDDAHIVEGNSGIKKLKKMERDGSISNIQYHIDPNKSALIFEFNFELTSRGKYENPDC
ncbi:hypothetical protein [Aeromonas sp. SG16]|uniref:hypothetical protein n=1 Tax=Aeromonas sp. SG16 TaxID=2950548 RepID=UPI00210E138A|nr:hypothetical protein [Aeromonas sp. SG16]MCQ4053093.1 hypothetical protein [Aeromonas sp. SG16]